MTTITRTEWLAELERVLAYGASEDGVTSQEIMDVTGWGEKRVRKALHRLHAENRLSIGRGKRKSMIGVTTVVPVYRMHDNTTPVSVQNT